MTNHPNRNRSKQQQSTHTPGPWPLKDVRTLLRSDKDCDYGRKPIDDPEVETNARLIAAAPELLAALKTLVGLLDVQADEMEEAGIAILPEREAARAIIDKAEGR